MASLGKKILSAFVEMTDEENPVASPDEPTQQPTREAPLYKPDTGTSEKFKQYFDKLFTEANIPGPDYFEFSKMTEAMMSIPDEKARFTAAFAGLGVQGLDKDKLLKTAAEYLQILEQDDANFNATVDAALKEKVEGKRQEIKAKQQRIDQIAMEISDLQNKIQLLQLEVKENEEKIESSSSGYRASAEKMKQRIEHDIDQIKKYITG